ncbi:MAG: chemotaxis protein CheA [Gemmatimonadaceae bacterium]|nr:chemotaxis protein CheA [Gemmatimonadaceae bacterium]
MDSARYRDLFLTEARDHLVAINQALIALEHIPRASQPAAGAGDGASDGATRASVDALFRAVHTVKGMSGVMGYVAVGSLSHAMETLLARVRAGEEALDGEQLALLFDASDALEAAIEGAAGAQESALDVTSLVERLQGRASVVRAMAADLAAVAPGGPALPAGDGVAVHVVLEPGTILPGARAQLVVARARTLGAVTAVVPDEGAMLGDEFDGTFALRLVCDADDAAIEGALRAAGFVQGVRVVHGAAGAPRPAAGRVAPDGDADAPDAAVPRTAAPRPDAEARFAAAWGSEALKAPLQRYVRIDLRRLDQLMALVGELMIVRGRLAQRATLHADPALDEAVSEASRFIGELQDAVLGGRMVPVWQVFDRFPRVVRDAARTLGKDVEFVIEGREIELDRSLLEQVADPLVHLLRNAIDHGIEDPDARLAAGKPAAGRLTLSASRERNAVVIRLRDDGRGVSRARVLAKAKALGLVDEERESLEDEEILRVIARAGFSTAERVTELSGRGVGIDAVVSRVRALGGVVDLRSAEGEGTTFSLRLPVTLAVIPALLARVGGESYALPLTHVTETLQLSRGVVRTVRGREVIVIREEVLPLLHLRDVVGLPGRDAGHDASASHVVLVEMAERRAGLVVDQLVGQEEIVVKPFDAVRGAASCFNGATIMGDGSAALILEVGSLL